MTFLKFGMLGVTDSSDTLALDLQLRCAEGVGGGHQPDQPLDDVADSFCISVIVKFKFSGFTPSISVRHRRDRSEYE